MLHDGEVPFEAVVNTVPAMIWRADASTAANFFNTAWLDFTGRTLEQELATAWAERVYPEDVGQSMQTFLGAFASREPFTMEYRVRRHDGAWRWLLDNGRPYFVGEHFAGYIGSCVDVTEMRSALDRRHQAAEEREALLTELQHRVRNNAQATASFLTLHAGRTRDPAVAAALRGAASRVVLSSLVQDRMFRAGNAAALDLGEELGATARAVLNHLRAPELRLEVRVEAPVRVPVRQAAPIGLIVNELLSNTARHGFPDGRPGRVRLTVRRPAPERGEVVLEDDGVGLPDPVPETGLGLYLARRLTQQARAELALSRTPGTRAALTFAIPA